MEKDEKGKIVAAKSSSQQTECDNDKLPSPLTSQLMDRKTLYQRLVAVLASALALTLVVWGIVALVKHSTKSDPYELEPDKKFVRIASAKQSGPTEPSKPRDYSRVLQDVRNYCTDQGMMIVDGETPTGFEAIGYSMRLVVTVEETRGESFPDLVDRLVWKTAPCNETVPVKRTKMFMYEGLLDKDHPEFGYVYLRLFECGDHYVFIQGLGTAAKDDVIYQARAVAAEIMRKLGIS